MAFRMNSKPFVIGIAGGSGSGKTFFLNCFLNHFKPADICLLSQDDYYRPKHLQKIDENGWINFDLPEGIDDEKLFSDLNKLITGETIQKKQYTFNISEDKAQLLTIKSAPIIIVEGLFIFHYKEVSQLFDMKLFMDADEEISLNRRIKRDAEERGYDCDMVKYQWIKHVMPAYNSYLLPYKNSADKIIMNNTQVADDIVMATRELSIELQQSVLHNLIKE